MVSNENGLGYYTILQYNQQITYQFYNIIDTYYIYYMRLHIYIYIYIYMYMYINNTHYLHIHIYILSHATVLWPIWCGILESVPRPWPPEPPVFIPQLRSSKAGGHAVRRPKKWLGCWKKNSCVTEIVFQKKSLMFVCCFGCLMFSCFCLMFVGSGMDRRWGYENNFAMVCLRTCVHNL